MDFNIAENDARQNCRPRIYHHGLADGHYGLGKRIIALSLAKRLINLFQMSKNTWVPPTSDPNGQVVKLSQLCFHISFNDAPIIQLLKDHLDKQAKTVSEVNY